jgi:hypothetical protein
VLVDDLVEVYLPVFQVFVEQFGLEDSSSLQSFDALEEIPLFGFSTLENIADKEGVVLHEALRPESGRVASEFFDSFAQFHVKLL